MMLRAFLARLIHPILVLMHRGFIRVMLTVATFEARGRQLQHATRTLLLTHVFVAA